jgi:sodium/potassium-transporting ATPase subunit beta
MGAEKRLSKQISQAPADNTLLGGTAIKPAGWDRTGLEAFKYLLYNPDTGAILTRTPLSWLKIFVFYCIYYSCLAAFWAAMLYVFFVTTVPDTHPRWMLDESLIGINPGLGVKPGPTDKRVDSSLYKLWASGANAKNASGHKKGEGDMNIDYAARMDIFLEKNGFNDDVGLADCTENRVRLEKEERCKFDLTTLSECQGPHYGYMQKIGEEWINPCFFLKLNRIYNWSPKPITPDDKEFKLMPADLQTKATAEPDHVWIDCHGIKPADKEALLGKIDYYPGQGIPFKYFPYMGKNQPYHAPLVAIRIRPDKKFLGRLVHVQCLAWFKGVEHSSKDKMGLTTFEVLLYPDGVVDKSTS